MLKDNEVLFSGASGDSPTSTGDNISTNVWDSSPLGLPTGSGGGSPVANVGRDFGIGGEAWLEVLVTVAVTASGGAASVNFELVTDSTSTIVTKNILVASGVIAKATLIAGYKYRVQLPAADPASTTPYKRYIALDYLIATNTLTTGTFESKIVLNVQEADLYQSGFAVV